MSSRCRGDVAARWRPRRAPDHRLGVAEGRLLETGRHRQRAAQALNRVRPAPNVAGERVPYIKRSPGLRTNRGKVKDNRRSAREIAEPAGKTNSPLGLSFPMEPRSFVDVPAWTVPNRNTRCHRGLNPQAARRGRLHREAAISAESPSAERNPDRPNARPGFLYIEAPAQWLRTGASRLGFLCGGGRPPTV